MTDQPQRMSDDWLETYEAMLYRKQDSLFKERTTQLLAEATRAREAEADLDVDWACRYTLMEEERDSLGEDATTLRGELKDLVEFKEQLLAEGAERRRLLGEQISGLKEDNATLRAEVTRLEGALRTQNAMKNDARVEVEVLSSSNHALNKEVTRLEQFESAYEALRAREGEEGGDE